MSGVFAVLSRADGAGDGGRLGRRAAGQGPRDKVQIVGRGGDHVDGQLDMHRARPGAGEQGEGARQHLRQLAGVQDGVAERGHPAHHGLLRPQLVQAALGHRQLLGAVDR